MASANARALADPVRARSAVSLTVAAWVALAYVRSGDLPEARRFLAAITPVLERMEPQMSIHSGAGRSVAAAAWELGAQEFAPSYRRLALALVTACLGSFPLFSVELTVARIAALTGNRVEAEEFFGKARAVLEASGQRPQRAIADYDEALTLLRAGSTDHARISALLDAARAQSRALGMEGWTARALRQAELLNEQRHVGIQATQRYPDGLSPREVEVLRVLAAGGSNQEIAQELVLSPHTVGRHIANIHAKINAHGRADATAYALRHGLLTPGPP